MGTQSCTLDVDAPAARVWEVLVDIDRWPEWNASVEHARRLDDGALRRGSRAVLDQPKLPEATWTVTEVEPGRAFVWEQRRPGVRTRGGHVLTPLEHGGTRVLLSIDQTGWMAPAIDLVYGRLTRRYLELEAAGIKQRAEQDRGQDRGQD